MPKRSSILLILRCKICRCAFRVRPSALKNGKCCCSRMCADLSKKINGIPANKRGSFKKCNYCNQDFYVQTCDTQRRKFCSQKCYSAHLRTQVGSLAYAWSGVRSNDSTMRDSAEAKAWRIKVFTRDNFTCAYCGKRGGNLEAHHLKPFSTHPDLRFDVSNGQTLCEPCHRTTDSFGSKARRHKQIGEWKQQVILP